jgi:hypothetical protein
MIFLNFSTAILEEYFKIDYISYPPFIRNSHHSTQNSISSSSSSYHHHNHHHYHHQIVCLMTGLQPIPKRVLQGMKSSASSPKFHYLLRFLRSSTSSLRLLPRLPIHIKIINSTKNMLPIYVSLVYAVFVYYPDYRRPDFDFVQFYFHKKRIISRIRKS